MFANILPVLIGLSPAIIVGGFYAVVGIADAAHRRRNAREAEYQRAQRIADAHARLGDRVRAAR